jgi:hypothetical protein
MVLIRVSLKKPDLASDLKQAQTLKGVKFLLVMRDMGYRDCLDKFAE